jgi:hypothetical protein
MHQTRIFDQPDQVHAQLQALGLKLDLVNRCLIKGFVGRTNCTAHDPLQTPGTDAWRYVTRGLRDELVPLGWRKADPKGLPVIINDKLETILTVTSGDRATGYAHLDPKQKNPKGPMTEGAVRVNAVQSELFPEIVPDEEIEAVLPPYAFWTLLINITGQEIRAEVSQLAKMAGGKATFWLNRIILPSFVPDPAEWREMDDDKGDDIEVLVQRKQA